ncbi:MAG TPA: AsnC family transcriptional regulator [Rhizobiales bacterium]|nr:AsnC family transcriptional regulator [Hyphomicrobiales bacterium]
MKNTEISEKLDAYDMAILNALQINGRISVVDLAKHIHLSPTPCTTRLKRLEKLGFIDGYFARLSADLLDRGLLAFLQVRLSSTDEPTLQSFNRAVLGIRQIQECHMVGGGFDYLLKVRVKDMDAFRDFLGRVISRLPEIENTHSYFVMEQVKETTALYLD